MRRNAVSSAADCHDSATSEIESQELLYHSWPTPKSLNCVAFMQHPSKKDRAIIGWGARLLRL
jgi:hypothetical protein